MFRALQSSLPRALASPVSRSVVNNHTFRRLLSTEVRTALQAAVDSKPIVLFMKGTPSQPQCGFSRATIQVLEMQGVPHEKMRTYNVLEDEELREGIKAFSEWPTIPQLYVDGEFLGGCDIVLGMHQSGELETLLEDKKIIPLAEPSALQAAEAAKQDTAAKKAPPSESAPKSS